MPSDVTYRPATAADAEAYYGRNPGLTFRGYVAVKGDEVLGICGVNYTNGMRVAFSEFKEALRSDRRALAKGVKMTMKLVNQIKGPVYAVADDEEPTAAKLLAKLGWVPTGVHGPHGETLVRG
jgi:hypothetical protein